MEEEESEEIPAVSLNVILNYMTRLKQLGHKLENNKMFDLFYDVQSIL